MKKSAQSSHENNSYGKQFFRLFGTVQLEIIDRELYSCRKRFKRNGFHVKYSPVHKIDQSCYIFVIHIFTYKNQ